MPEALLIRHAKSDWDAGAESDRLRPLSRRGVAAAETMGRVLRLARRVPEVVFTSPAERARSTAEIAAYSGDWDAEIREVDALYGGGPSEVLSLLLTAGGYDRVAVVGHEPTWSTTVALLIGGGEVRMPTAAVAAIEIPTWSVVSPGAGRLVWLLTPRLFTDGDLAV
jgi:phosphohistidine phosphatase